MFRLEIIDSTNLKEWYEYFDRLEAKGIYHDPKYITLLADHFNAEAELCIFGDNDLFVYYPYYRRSISDLHYGDSHLELGECSDIVSSWYYGGPILSSNSHPNAKEIITEFCKSFSKYCDKARIISEFIRFDPNLKNYKDFICLKPSFDRETVYVDLKKSEYEIWNLYEKRNQRAIKKAMKSGIVAERGTNRRNLKIFSKIYLSEMERKRALKHYWFSYETLEKMFEKLKNNFELVVTLFDDCVIGGFVIARGYGIAHHFLSASLPEYWSYRVNNLMYHTAIVVSKELGDRIFDFQGGRRGVFEFKKGFSPFRGKFCVSKIIRNSQIYYKLVKIAKLQGVVSNGFFPEYRPRE